MGCLGNGHKRRDMDSNTNMPDSDPELDNNSAEPIKVDMVYAGTS